MAIHKMKVIKKVEELIYSTKLENIIDEYYNLNTSTDILEEIDNQISAVLDAARRYVEESKWSVPFSVIKVEIRVEYLYWLA